MPKFIYQAKDRRSNTISGEIESISLDSAKRELRLSGLMVSEIEEKSSLKTNQGFFAAVKDRMPIGTKDRVFFCRQLALMLRSGMPLVNALEVMSDDFPKKKFRVLLQDVIMSLRQGSSLYEALSKHRKLFSPLLVQVVEAAEESGEMSQSLLAVSEQLKFRNRMKKKAISAFIYPSIIMVVAMFVGAFMVFKIIPKFDEFLSKRNIPLPHSTQFVIGISRFAQEYWLHGLILFFIMVIAFIFAFRNAIGRRIIEKYSLNLPLFGKLCTLSTMAGFSSSSALLLKSGLGVVESLELNSRMIPMFIYKDLFLDASKKIINGSSLKESLAQPIIPATLINVISIGEETGALHNVLEELGDFYGDEVEAAVDFIVSAIEPMLLVIVGSIVALVYFALFQAIIKLMGT